MQSGHAPPILLDQLGVEPGAAIVVVVVLPFSTQVVDEQTASLRLRGRRRSGITTTSLRLPLAH